MIKRGFNIIWFKFYISCAYGINILGVYSVITGSSSLLFSILIGRIVRFINKTLLISMVIVLLIIILVYLDYWTIESNVLVMFGLSVYFGLSEATWAVFMHGWFRRVYRDCIYD